MQGQGKGREEIPEKLKNEEIDTVEQLLLCLKQEVFPEGAYGMDDDDEQQLQPMELSSQLKIFIFITEQLIGPDVESFVDKMKQLLMIFNKKTESIQFKFLMEDSLWKKYREEFGELKGTVKKLQLSVRDVRHFLYGNMNTRLFDTYVDAMNIHNGLSDDMDRKSRRTDERNIQYVLDLIFGVWKLDSMYSESVFECIYDFMKHHRRISYNRLLDALKSAAKKELQISDEENTDRLMGFDVLVEELEKLVG